jgi:hypothetical protein
MYAVQSAQMKLSGQKKKLLQIDMKTEENEIYVHIMISFHPSLSITSFSLLGMNSIMLFRDLEPLSTSSLLIWAGIIWIVPVKSQNPPQGDLSHLNMAPDFLEKNLSFSELKGSPFFLSG